ARSCSFHAGLCFTARALCSTCSFAHLRLAPRPMAPLAGLHLRMRHSTVVPQSRVAAALQPERLMPFRPIEEGSKLQVLVRDNNVDQALRVLKKKLQREGVFREMKARRAYEKPSERRAREKAEAIRRSRKLARKQAQREGLLPKPKRKAPAVRAAAR